MKVALVTNLFPPIQTGSSYWVQQAAEALARLGDEVVVITCSLSGREEVESSGEYVVYRLPSVRHVPQHRLFMGFNQFYLLYSPRNLERIISILRDHHTEVVHQCGQLLDSTVLAYRACRQLDLPSVCSLHTKIFHPGSRLYDLALQAADRFIVAPFIRRFELVLALDKEIANYARAVYNPRCLGIMPVCIDAGILDEVPAQPAAPGAVHIASIGHLTEARDRRELVGAVGALRQRGVDVRLTIAGKVLVSGTAKRIEAAGLAQSVDLVGEVPHGAPLFDLLRSAHVEAHWLEMPGVGSAGMEAMALGLPVVTYAYPQIYGDVPLRHGENIWFIDPHDPETITEVLGTLAEDPALRKRVGEQGRQLVRDYLTWAQGGARLRGFYSSVVVGAAVPNVV
jgi:glycosyltransferase involved in cell wall biosynthesis